MTVSEKEGDEADDENSFNCELENWSEGPVHGGGQSVLGGYRIGSIPVSVAEKIIGTEGRKSFNHCIGIKESN